MRVVVVRLWWCCHLLPHPCGNAFGMRVVATLSACGLWCSPLSVGCLRFALLVLVGCLRLALPCLCCLAVFGWLCLAGVGWLFSFGFALPVLLLYGNRFPPKSGQSAAASSWGESCEGDCSTAVQAGAIWLAGSRVANVVRVVCSTPMLKF